MADFCVKQGPVVQSVVSLTSSLRVISLTVLADSIYNILIFFQQKISAYLRITRLNLWREDIFFFPRSVRPSQNHVRFVT